MPDRILGAAAAQALQDEASVAGEELAWFVMTGDGDHPKQAIARPVAAGRGALPSVLVAGSLGELRAQLPAGLVRCERQLADPPGVVEIWFTARR
jgi:hypothetical protein